MIINDSITSAANSQETTATLLTTKEAAELLGVSVNTLRQWRQRKLFGCPFFTADTFYGNTAYYDRERVEQLKAIYQPGVLQDMYKLARLNSEDNPPYYFQNSVTWLRNAGNLRKLLKEYKSPRGHNGFYSLAQVAEIFNVTERTVQQWVDSKELQWSRYDHANKLLFDRGNLEALVARRSEEPPELYHGGKSMNSEITRGITDEEFYENFHGYTGEVPEGFGILPESECDAEYRRLIKADIVEAQARLDELPATQRRGLAPETLRHFKCGYLPEWIHPQVRADFACGRYVDETGKPKKLPPPSERIIIPTLSMEHFNSVATPRARFRMRREYWKQHAGKKNELFCDETALTHDVIVVVEGEADAMSIWQVSDKNFGIVSILGASNWQRNVMTKLSLFRGKRLILLFDADATGRARAKEMERALVEAGYIATVDFLYEHMPADFKKNPNNIKVDANEILATFGENELKLVLYRVFEQAENGFAYAEKKIKEREQEQAAAFNGATDISKTKFAKVKEDSSLAATVKASKKDNRSIEDSPEIDEIIAAINETITPAEFEGKGYLRKSERGEKTENHGYECVYCTSGTGPNRSGALNFDERNGIWQHYCFSCNNGGNNIKFLARIYNLDTSGGDFIELLRRAIDDFNLPFDRDALNPQNKKSHKPKDKPKDIPIDLLLSEEQKQKLFGNTSRDDLSNGMRLADLWSRELRYLKDADKWLTYSKGLWTVGTDSRTSAIMSQISRTAKILAANAVSDDEKKVAACFTQSRKISGAILFLKGVDAVIVTEKDLDKHPYLLNCRDCVVDLQTGKRLEADPKLLLTRQAGAIYRGIDYRDPDNHVEKFLQSIMPNDETRRALLRFLGYALTGVIREHVAQLWRGDGRNGKSTLIKFLFMVLGTYAVKLPMTALLDSGRPADPNQATTALNALEGARLAICDELMRRARLNTALFKTLTGGDEITIRHLHAEFKTIQASAKIIFNGNYLPEIDDPTDLGLRERLRNVPFNQTFIGDRADPNLQEKLSTSEALSALLAILVAESVTWHNDGLLESAEMKEAKREYISSNDFISEFIDEHCNRGINLSIPRKTLLAALKENYPGECARIFGNNDRALTDAIKRLEGISYLHKKRGYVFNGIGLKDEPEQQSFDEFRGEPIAADTAVPAFDENDLPLDD